MRRSLLVLSGLLVASGVASASPSPSTGRAVYVGSARTLALTAHEAKYQRITKAYADAPSHPENRPGFKSGWTVNYEDATAHSDAGAQVTIYVYDNRTHAEAIYKHVCKTACPAQEVIKGIHVGYSTQTYHSVPTVSAGATCRNLYLDVATGATTETPKQLGYDAGYLIAAVFAKAYLHGMKSC